MELSYFNVIEGGNVEGWSAEKQNYVTLFIY